MTLDEWWRIQTMPDESGTVLVSSPQDMWQAAQKEAARRCAEIAMLNWAGEHAAKAIEREFGLDRHE